MLTARLFAAVVIAVARVACGEVATAAVVAVGAGSDDAVLEMLCTNGGRNRIDLLSGVGIDRAVQVDDAGKRKDSIA